MIRSIWRGLFRREASSRQAIVRLSVEQLESRVLPSSAQPAALEPTYVILPHDGVSPYSTSGPTGYTPAQIHAAYGFNQISFDNGAVAGNGSGTTIAIVDAYSDPDITSDLHQFDSAFGLPNPTLTVVNQSGGTKLPAANASWSDEISLDVEWAHAIAPAANILLVEANSSSYTNLFAAVSYAAAQPGVVVVSMSWGGAEFSGETSYDSTFTTPAGHAGVTFVVSSGDSGAPASYPATSPNVLTAGGTTLELTSSGSIESETGWTGSGGGISSYEAEPSYQNGVVTQSSTFRTSPDVSYDADPNTGFPVYDSYANGSSAPWEQFGGTSDAAPQWAALIAIADQGRALAGLGSLDGRSQTLPDIYSLPAADFHDITSGTSTGTPNYSAGPGYDLVTGRGTPVANLIVAALADQTTTTTAPTHLAITTTAASTAGSAFDITVTAFNATGTTDAGYTGTVQFSSSDPLAGLPANFTFTTANAGSHTFLVTLKTAGSQTITVADTSNSSIGGSATVTVSPAAPSTLAFSQEPSAAAPGAVISPAITVRVLDAYGNLVSIDNTDKVSIAISSNPGSGTLAGTTSMTVSGGIATFSNLSINNAGTGYTLTASAGSLAPGTSATFNIGIISNLIEGFETPDSWNIADGYSINGYLSTAAAHDGNYGLDQYNGNQWIYRDDPAAQVATGDSVSVWLQFSGAADGRAYFGFGAGPFGTLSLVAAPNTNQLMLMYDPGFNNFITMAAVSQTYVANQWYRLEVDWGASGTIVGKLFASNGTTLLQSVTAATTAITSGGIAFRAIGSDKYWDTVTAEYSVNSFAHGAAAATSRGPANPMIAPAGGAFAPPSFFPAPPSQPFVTGPSAPAALTIRAPAAESFRLEQPPAAAGAEEWEALLGSLFIRI